MNNIIVVKHTNREFAIYDPVSCCKLFIGTKKRIDFLFSELKRKMNIGEKSIDTERRLLEGE